MKFQRFAFQFIMASFLIGPVAHTLQGCGSPVNAGEDALQAAIERGNKNERAIAALNNVIARMQSRVTETTMLANQAITLATENSSRITDTEDWIEQVANDAGLNPLVISDFDGYYEEGSPENCTINYTILDGEVTYNAGTCGSANPTTSDKLKLIKLGDDQKVIFPKVDIKASGNTFGGIYSRTEKVFRNENNTIGFETLCKEHEFCNDGYPQ